VIESKRLEEWDIADIKRIFDNKFPEGTTLEYKKELPISDGEKNKLERSICSFANTHGGYIVVGIEASKTDNMPVAMEAVRWEDSEQDE